MKIASLVEATNVNAVAKVTLEFFRAARELAPPDDPVSGSLITFGRAAGSGTSNEFIAAADEAGIEIAVIPERGPWDFSVIGALKRIIEQRQPDIVITNSVKSHFVMWRSRLWKRYPWVAYHHGYTNTDTKMRLYNRFDRWSLPKADMLLTVCQAFAHELAAVNGIPVERVRVQHNSIRFRDPVPKVAADSVRNQLEIGEQRVVLTIGRLSAEKAQADLIAAFQRLKTANCKLVIVGDGPERENLQALAADSKPRSIVFAGQVADVDPFYAIADIFALPSHSEGSPNVLLEAMAAGIPVVATAVGGVPEIVQNEKSALLVSPNDPPALATAIDRLLHDQNLAGRLTKEARELVVRNHSPERYAGSLIEIYRGVIARRHQT